MADEQRDHHDEPADELSRGQESQADPKPRPHPTIEETKQEVEAEDRFEATDN